MVPVSFTAKHMDEEATHHPLPNTYRWPLHSPTPKQKSFQALVHEEGLTNPKWYHRKPVLRGHLQHRTRADAETARVRMPDCKKKKNLSSCSTTTAALPWSASASCLICQAKL